MKISRLIGLPLSTILLSSCGLPEEDFYEAFAEAVCEKSEQCLEDDFDDEMGYKDADDCLDAAMDEGDVFMDYMDEKGCDYDKGQAKDCVDGIKDIDCTGDAAEFSIDLSAALISCMKVYDCGDLPEDTFSDWDTDASHPDTKSSPPLMVSVIWGPHSVKLDIANGQGRYRWGIVQTDPQEDRPWTGEDGLYGYGPLLYLHPTSAWGTELYYAGNPYQLDESAETAFPSGEQAEHLTYSLWDATGRTCLGSWGADPAYYADFCEEWTVPEQGRQNPMRERLLFYKP